MKLTVHEFVSLDGVMQSPGNPDEDASNGFDRGGWQAPFTEDEGFRSILSAWFDQAQEFLLGRSTYDMMHAFWSKVTDPDNTVAAKLNSLPKHVVTSTLTHPQWQNTSVISSNIVESVRALKKRPGQELQLHGSWQLVQTLHNANLIDEYHLMTVPIVLGTGKRLFDTDSTPSGFTPIDSALLKNGAIHQVLQPTPFNTGKQIVAESGKWTTLTHPDNH